MGVSADDIGDRDIVLAGAVDVDGQSVNREKYNPNPAAVISVARGNVAAAGVQPTNLPPPTVGPTGSSTSFTPTTFLRTITLHTPRSEFTDRTRGGARTTGLTRRRRLGSGNCSRAGSRLCIASLRPRRKSS